jgi:transposase-like protein
MSDPSTDDLIRRHRAGESISAIAAATGLHPSTVRYRVKLAKRPKSSAGPPEALSEESQRLLGLAGPLSEIQRAALKAAARLAARGAAPTPRAIADELGHRGNCTGYNRVLRAVRVLQSLGRWPYDRPGAAP